LPDSFLQRIERCCGGFGGWLAGDPGRSIADHLYFMTRRNFS
jgi:hypothetical protein